jgi:hypothetical protein
MRSFDTRSPASSTASNQHIKTDPTDCTLRRVGLRLRRDDLLGPAPHQNGDSHRARPGIPSSPRPTHRDPPPHRLLIRTQKSGLTPPFTLPDEAHLPSDRQKFESLTCTLTNEPQQSISPRWRRSRLAEATGAPTHPTSPPYLFSPLPALRTPRERPVTTQAAHLNGPTALSAFPEHPC